jgi:hypothetical protein
MNGVFFLKDMCLNWIPRKYAMHQQNNMIEEHFEMKCKMFREHMDKARKNPESRRVQQNQHMAQKLHRMLLLGHEMNEYDKEYSKVLEWLIDNSLCFQDLNDARKEFFFLK